MANDKQSHLRVGHDEVIAHIDYYILDLAHELIVEAKDLTA
jgi:hypothetical protein